MSTNLQVRYELTAAREALILGDCRGVRTLAGRGLAAAVGRRDKHSQAIALLLLGHALTLESKMQWAHQFVTRAQILFSEIQDPVGISDCCLSLSYIDSALGRHDQALCAARDAFIGAGGIDRRRASGLNYYGVASFWMRDYGTAQGVLDAACEFAKEEAGSVAGTFQPLINACFTEVLRVNDSQLRGHRVDGSELERYVAHSQELVNAGMTVNLTKGPVDSGMFLLEFASCFIASRRGRNDLADMHYLGCLERAANLPDSSWMRALVWWARLERAKVAAELREATESADAMVALANASEHVPLKALAEALRADLRTSVGTGPP